MRATGSQVPAWVELGVLAERAAMAVDDREAELVDHRLATVLATVVAAPDGCPASTEVVRFAAAARDVARPLHLRVAAVAALHQALRAESSKIHQFRGEDT
jgi:hypothetical protein